jgi:hypothetical protein
MDKEQKDNLNTQARARTVARSGEQRNRLGRHDFVLDFPQGNTVDCRLEMDGKPLRCTGVTVRAMVDNLVQVEIEIEAGATLFQGKAEVVLVGDWAMPYELADVACKPSDSSDDADLALRYHAITRILQKYHIITNDESGRIVPFSRVQAESTTTP